MDLLGPPARAAEAVEGLVADGGRGEADAMHSGVVLAGKARKEADGHERGDGTPEAARTGAVEQ